MAKERPQIEHEGLCYLRNGGEWTREHLAVQKALSNKLDSIARQNPELWKRCLEQDQLDASTGSGPRRRLVPTTDGAGYHAVVQHDLRRGPQGSGLSADFIGERIRVTCNICMGWRKTRGGWSYSDATEIELGAGWKLICKVTVVEDKWKCDRRTSGQVPDDRPAPSVNALITLQDMVAKQHDPDGPIPPRFDRHEDRGEPVALILNDDVCVFEIPFFADKSRGSLNANLPWKESGFKVNRRCIYERFHVRDGIALSRPFQFLLEATLSRQPGAAPDVEE